MTKIQEEIKKVLSRQLSTPLWSRGLDKQHWYAQNRINRIVEKEYKREYKREWQWAMRLQPFDLINTCGSFPYNSRIKEISFRKRYYGFDDYPDFGFGWRYDHHNELKIHNTERWIITGFDCIDTEGNSHYFPDGGCLEMPYELDKIRDTFTDPKAQPMMDDFGVKV